MNYLDYFFAYYRKYAFKRRLFYPTGWHLFLGLFLGVLTYGFAREITACPDLKCDSALFIAFFTIFIYFLILKLWFYMKRVFLYPFMRTSFAATFLGLSVIPLIFWTQFIPLVYLGAGLLIWGGLRNFFGILKKIGSSNGKDFFYLSHDYIWIFPQKKTWCLIVCADREPENIKSFLSEILPLGLKKIICIGESGEWILEKSKSLGLDVSSKYYPNLEDAFSHSLVAQGVEVVFIVDLTGGTYLKQAKSFFDFRSKLELR